MNEEQKKARIRKIIIWDLITSAIVIVGVVVWYQLKDKTPSETAVVTPTIGTEEPFKPSADLSQSTFASLRSGAVFAVGFFPPSLKTVVRDVSDLTHKLVAAGVVEQAELDLILEKMKTPPTEAAGRGLAAVQHWEQIKEISLAIYPGTPDSKHMMQVLGELRTASPVVLDAIGAGLDALADAAPGAGSAESPLTVQKLAAGKYRALLRSKEGNAEEAVLITFGTDAVAMVSEGMSRSDFVLSSAVADGRMLASTAWRAVRTDPTSEVTYAFAVNYDQLNRLLGKMQDLIRQGGNSDASVERIVASLSQFGELAGVVGFDRGLVSSQCIELRTSKSDQAERYIKMVRQMGARQSAAVLPGLIDATTVVAATMPISDLDLLGEYLAMSIPSATIDEAAKDPAIKEVIDILKRHSKMVKEFPFRQIDVALGVGGGAGFLPSVGVLLSGKEPAKAQAFLTEVKAVVDEISKKPELLTLADDPMSPGNKMLRFELQPGMVVTAAVVGEGSLALAFSPLTPQAVLERSARSGAVHQGRTVRGVPLLEVLQKGQALYYLSFAPVLEFARPFVPMMVQGAGPAAQARLKNLDAVIALFSSSFLMQAEYRVRDDAVVCNEGRINQIR